MSARARRRAFAFGSLARNGLIGARPGVTLALRTGVGTLVPLNGRGGIAGRGDDGPAAPEGDVAGPAEATRGEKITGRCGGPLDAAGGIAGALFAEPGRAGGVNTPAGGVSGRGMAGVGGRTGVGCLGASSGATVGVGDAVTITAETLAIEAATSAGSASAAMTAGAACTGETGNPNSSSIEPAPPTVTTPPQTEQRARTPTRGTLSGSTRKTERHSGQDTFTRPPSELQIGSSMRREDRHRSPVARRCAGRWKIRNQAMSWRSSSSLSPVR